MIKVTMDKDDFLHMTKVVKECIVFLEDYTRPTKDPEMTIFNRSIGNIKEIITMFESHFNEGDPPEGDEGPEDSRNDRSSTGDGNMEATISYEGKKYTKKEVEKMAKDIEKAAEIDIDVDYKGRKSSKSSGGGKGRIDMNPAAIRRWNRG